MTEVTRKRHSGGRPDEPVGAVAHVGRDEQGDAGGQRDAEEVAGDDAEHHHDDEHPQQQAARVAERLVRGEQVEHEAGGVDDQRHRRRGLHDPLLVMVVDEAAEPDPGRRDGDEEDPGDHAGGEHRLGLEVDPEGHGEPHGEVHDRHGQRVEQQVQEGSLRRLAKVEPGSLGGHGVVLLGVHRR